MFSVSFCDLGLGWRKWAGWLFNSEVESVFYLGWLDAWDGGGTGKEKWKVKGKREDVYRELIHLFCGSSRFWLNAMVRVVEECGWFSVSALLVFCVVWFLGVWAGLFTLLSLLKLKFRGARDR